MVNINLSEIHLLSFESFNKLGYVCNLWIYDDFDTSELPTFVNVKDASDIHPKIEMNNIRFSDYIRYKIIHKYGGIYSDCDNILINPLPDIDYIFSGDKSTLNNHLFKCPKGSTFLGQLINDIENSDMSLGFMMGVSDSLLDRVYYGNKEKYIIDYSKTYYFQRDVEGFHSRVVDFNSLDDIYTIHLFESSIRVVYRNSDNFKENIKNLKQFILWE